MEYRGKSPYRCTVEELDRELIARGNRTPFNRRFAFIDKEGTPARHAVMAQLEKFYHNAVSHKPDPALRHITTWELTEALVYMTEGVPLDDTRAISGRDDRKDIFQLGNNPVDTEIKKNVNSVAAICMKEDLIDSNDGTSTLKLKNYGKTFNLCHCEPFFQQPVAAGHLFTGFLVKDDIIATAGHCVDENKVSDTRIFFGYQMKAPCTPGHRVNGQPGHQVNRQPGHLLREDIFRGTEIIEARYPHPTVSQEIGPDWALVKLDRKVTGRQPVKFPDAEISGCPPVYVIGHPCGLPIKYAAGANVLKIEKNYLVADLDIYAGNSGSPIFHQNTHQLMGMVVRGDNRDFRWTGNCYISVTRPSMNIKLNSRVLNGAQCTRVSEFITYC